MYSWLDFHFAWFYAYIRFHSVHALFNRFPYLVGFDRQVVVDAYLLEYYYFIIFSKQLTFYYYYYFTLADIITKEVENNEIILVCTTLINLM